MGGPPVPRLAVCGVAATMVGGVVKCPFVTRFPLESKTGGTHDEIGNSTTDVPVVGALFA
jgi:hypothetical protein